MDLTLAHITEGRKMLARAMSNKPFKKYKGDAQSICRQIVGECWNGRFFQTSMGHFDVFYMRDFGFCVEGLMYLGYKHEVTQTIEWALKIYQKWNMLTTTITNDEKPIHVFYYSPDTLPLLLKSIRVSGTRFLANEFIDFLNEQIRYYHENVIDKDRGIINPNKQFSSMRDHYTRKSSMYDNCMLAMLPEEIEKLRSKGIKLVNPFKKYNFQKILIDRFWVGTHFLDDLTMDHHIASDANILPYYCEIFHDKEMMWSSMNMMQKYNLDKPLPAKYAKVAQKSKENILLGTLAPNYEGNTCWGHLGMLYIYMVQKIDKHLLRVYLENFAEYIERYQTFLEIYTSDGKPYKTSFYKTDEGMLWSAMFLHLLSYL